MCPLEFEQGAGEIGRHSTPLLLQVSAAAIGIRCIPLARQGATTLSPVAHPGLAPFWSCPFCEFSGAFEGAPSWDGLELHDNLDLDSTRRLALFADCRRAESNQSRLGLLSDAEPPVADEPDPNCRADCEPVKLSKSKP